MKAILIAALMLAVIISPVDAGYLVIKAAGNNPTFQISVDGTPINVYPDGSGPTIITKNTAVISVVAPGIKYTETITTNGVTTYAVPYGALVTPAPPTTPSPPAVEEKEPKKDKPKKAKK